MIIMNTFEEKKMWRVGLGERQCDKDSGKSVPKFLLAPRGAEA